MPSVSEFVTSKWGINTLQGGSSCHGGGSPEGDRRIAASSSTAGLGGLLEVTKSVAAALDVEEMGGVEEAEGGYYIVIGGGLPRIDVVGFNRQVNWAVLLERLVQATRSQGPVVQ